uniref:Uncharacterized protein n=1 Tax=viral metagenome TaxID=1070528 RepID=A0A6C0M3Q2_9ZZZZ
MQINNETMHANPILCKCACSMEAHFTRWCSYAHVAIAITAMAAMMPVLFLQMI